MRWVFGAYVIFIFTLTHWPNLKLEIPIHRPDLLAHLSVFSLWTVLACFCGLIDSALSMKNTIWSFILAVAYVGIDEGAQYPDFVHRTAAWDDYWFDVIGVLVGTALVLLARKLRK